MDTLQQWINGKGDRAATELAKILEGLKYDPAAVVAAIQAEQLAAEADALKQRLLDLAARGLDLTAASAVVADLAEQQQKPDRAE